MWCGRGNQKKGIGKHVKKMYSTIHENQNDNVEKCERGGVARFLCFL
jgi:hypothetical protein